MEKDNKNISFIHKFLIIFTVILCILSFSITNTVYGATYDLSDYQNCVRGSWNWCIVHTLENDKFYFITTTNNGRYIYTKGATYNGQACSSGYFDVTDRKIFGIYDFDDSTNKFVNYRETSMYGHVDLGYSEVIASSADVYYSGTDNVFFPKTPVPSRVVIHPTLTEIIQQELEELIPTIMSKTTMIIPIGLAIFSVLLVILLVKLVIWRMT